MTFGAKLFTSDVDVLHLIGIGTPVCHLVTLPTQTIGINHSFQYQTEAKTEFCFNLYSLLLLCNQSMPWRLFLMASTLELLILRTQLTPW